MINTSKNKKKWLFYAVSGLLFIGLGLSIFGEALIQKINNSPFIIYTELIDIIFNGDDETCPKPTGSPAKLPPLEY